MRESHDLPPLSPTLRALVDAERGNVTADPARAASVLAATEGVIALSLAAGGTAAAAASAGAVKTTAAAAAKGAVTISIGKAVGIAVVAFAVGTGVGAGVQSALAPRAVAQGPTATPVAVVPAPEAPRVEASVVPTSSAIAAAPPAQATRASAPPIASPSVTASAEPRARGDLAQEQAIIDAARAGLASGRNEDVILATDRHAQAFPRGQFSEERDAMRIIALARLGRSGDARRRADQFRSAYPASALLPKVEAALQ